MSRDLGSWMRLPYVEGGRDPQGVDCWGLVRLVRHALRGDWLPAFAQLDQRRRGGLAQVQDELFKLFSPVSDPVDGALVFVFNGGGLVDHCGIVITINGRLSVLDTSAGRGSRHVPCRVFEGFYRHVRYYDH